MAAAFYLACLFVAAAIIVSLEIAAAPVQPEQPLPPSWRAGLEGRERPNMARPSGKGVKP